MSPTRLGACLIGRRELLAHGVLSRDDQSVYEVTKPGRRIFVSPRAAERIAVARVALEELAGGSMALVLAPTQEAADELVRAAALKRGALFGVERLMLNRLLGLLAADYAAEKGLAFLTRLGARAVAARAIFHLQDDPRMQQFGGVNLLPGFAAALAAAHQTLKENRIDSSRLPSLDGAGEALAALLEQFEEELIVARLLDRAGMIDAAIESLRRGAGRRFSGIPLVLLDLALESLRERDLIAALAANSTTIIATVPAGDQRSKKLLAEALDLTSNTSAQAETAAAEDGTLRLPTSLARLQHYLFAPTMPAKAPPDKSVTVRSAAGEMQECVEIARDILAEVKKGTPFDRIAVLLHAPERYAPYMQEALARAGISAWFAGGASLPEPGGRALLALLNCAAERFSARRFAEYLSLAQLPETEPALQPGNKAAVNHQPKAAPGSGTAGPRLTHSPLSSPAQGLLFPDSGGVSHGSAIPLRRDKNPIPPPDHGEVRRGSSESSVFRAGTQTPEDRPAAASGQLSGGFMPAEADYMPAGIEIAANPGSEADPNPDAEVAVRAPWRWERLLVDAAVVNGCERWENRLRGLENELRLQRDEVDDDDTRAALLEHKLTDLAHLTTAALPIIERLAALPQAGNWGEWLQHLRALTAHAIRNDYEVLRTLADLEPMAPVGPITLNEVRIVLSERLGHLFSPPLRRRYGAVFVAPTSYARGLEFDVVMVPGLAERMFPKKLTEDPLLPDSMRQKLSSELPLQHDRVANERLALRLAAGCAKRAIFSYPRVDIDQGRPRVPAFYMLEILRAAEGRLPGFGELAKRAAGEQASRLGWPAPEQPQDAIDEVEFDLAVLDRLAGAAPETTVGAAHYLLDANPHLGRALRARARRWLHRWTPNDGMAEPDAEQLAALTRHQLGARSYSPTALQNYAACPYRFFLQAIVRLEPREEIIPLDVIDPLTRGALFHEVQFETLSALRGIGLLPVTPKNLILAYPVMEESLRRIAERMHEELVPAIERVWLDGIESIRADLREWMRRMAMAQDYRPERFELAFGLTDRKQADPASIEAPVPLVAGISLRGSIDLIERGPDARLRVTDHKTGRVRAEKDLVIGGGKTLQPLLYALAAEQILKEPVAAGRLYYCTAAGGYEERIATLDDFTRGAIEEFTRILGAALGQGFLPAAPGERECEFCDYRRICGPYEATRVQRKLATSGTKARMAELEKLRGMR
ncbi:MAG: PD-(D/E)XK nuclease family protein [Deltaproteobacteria bacterium]|nr:PD-(D/E)XK nuclease family protein [Deltaproteobacteria bacterium]